MRGADSPLVTYLLDRIAAHGPMPFADFVELALYHPEWGYYTGDRPGLGRTGDFLTAPEAHPLFGWLIGRQVAHLAAVIGSSGAFQVIELGAGTGALAAGVLDALRAAAPDLYVRLEYRIVEISPRLRVIQSERLARHAGRVGWVSLDDLPAGRTTGLVVANEFFDALPFHRLVMHDYKLREIYVDLDGGEFVDRVGALSDPALSATFERLGRWPPVGGQVEAAPLALTALDQVARALDRGVLLTIDYGYEVEEWLGKIRPRGSFLAHYRHTANDKPYQRIGRQDLTAHVDFTTLIQQGEKVGLRLLGLLEQRPYLGALGLRAAAEALAGLPGPPAERRRELDALSMLVDPAGMGRFQVLAQVKGLPDLTLERLLDLPEPAIDPHRLPRLPAEPAPADPLADLWAEAFGNRDSR